MNEKMKANLFEISESVKRVAGNLETFESPEALTSLSRSLRLQADAIDICAMMVAIS